MSEVESLKQKVETLEKQVKALMNEFCPKVAPRTTAEITAEVRLLIATKGPKGAAKEIARLNRLRKAQEAV